MLHDSPNRIGVRFAARSLAQVAVTEERELEIHDVEPPRAQHPIELQCWHVIRSRSKIRVEADNSRLMRTFSTLGIADQQNLATVAMRGLAALFVVDELHRRGDLDSSLPIRTARSCVGILQHR
jgi:hypothetical protein